MEVAAGVLVSIALGIMILRARANSVKSYTVPTSSPRRCWDILEEFGEFLARRDNSGERFVFSEELLPFPRSVIEKAFEEALATPLGKERRVFFENNRAALLSYVPPGRIPKDTLADIEYLEAVLSRDPGGSRLLTAAKIRVLGPAALQKRLNEMSPEQRVRLLQKLKVSDS